MAKTLAFSLAFFLLAAFPSFGQATLPAGSAATLDTALAIASLEPGEVALSVDAEHVKLIEDSQALPSGSSLTTVADAYGRIVRPFGTVSAVAPPTMSIIYGPPAHPNPFEDMPQGEVFKLLAASFTPENWQEILSDQGLGIDDLATDQQRQEFQAFFPTWQIKVAAENPDGDVDFDHPIQVTTDVSQVRIRLDQLVGLGLPVPNQPDSHIFSETVDPGGGTSYMALSNDDWSANMVDGGLVRDDLPNTLKASELNYDAPVFATQIPIANVKTAGDLIRTISNATHVELYVDRRLENKELTLVGASSAPAGDLLRALALCLTGTFRQVGSAFVLTDDLVGLGTRRQMWADFVAEGDAMRAPMNRLADTAITASNHSMLDIPWYGDPMALSESEISDWKDQVQHDGLFSAGGLFDVTVPFDQLTPTQQQAARETLAYDNKINASASIDGTVLVQTQLELEALVPSLDGPVQLGADMTHFFPDQRIEPTLAPASPPATQGLGAAAPRPIPPQPPLREALMSKPRRAVLTEPKTASQVDLIVASMKALGLNELWIVVFSQGVAHYPTKYASTDIPTDDTPDILTEAIKDTKGTGIRVYAALNLLQWGSDPPPDAVDLTILGETSRQAFVREQQDQQDASAEDNSNQPAPSPPTDPDPEVAVCPLAPNVVSALSGMVAELAATPGVAGLVWRDCAIPGYMPPPKYPSPDQQYDLGYNEAERLAFLRKEHVDPVDLSENSYSSGRANTRLDSFDSFDLDRSLYGAWEQFRNDSDMSFLCRIAGPANLDNGIKKSDGPKIPLLVQARKTAVWGNPPWYGSWENLQAPVPTYPDPMDGMDQNTLLRARAVSRISLYDDNFSSFNTQPDSARFVKDVAFTIDSLRNDPTYAGYVLDFTPSYRPNPFGAQPPAQNPASNPLAPLVAALSSSPPSNHAP